MGGLDFVCDITGESGRTTSFTPVVSLWRKEGCDDRDADTYVVRVGGQGYNKLSVHQFVRGANGSNPPLPPLVISRVKEELRKLHASKRNEKKAKDPERGRVNP